MHIPSSTIRSRLAVALVLAALALGGCRRGDDADCAAVADHYAEMVERQTREDGDPERIARMEANLPALEDAFSGACRRDEWNGAVRRCIVSAETIGALEACDPAAQPSGDDDASP